MLKLSKPLMRWIYKNYNPHTKIILDSSGVELVGGLMFCPSVRLREGKV